MSLYVVVLVSTQDVASLGQIQHTLFACATDHGDCRIPVSSHAPSVSLGEADATTYLFIHSWRLLKRDYLHVFKRPRLDLLTHTILASVVVDARSRLNKMFESSAAQEYHKSCRMAARLPTTLEQTF